MPKDTVAPSEETAELMKDAALVTKKAPRGVKRRVRQSWRKELEERRKIARQLHDDLAHAHAANGRTRAGYYHGDDALAERHVFGDHGAHGARISPVLEELAQARLLVQATVLAARTLEQDFLYGKSVALDPARDASLARPFVRKAYMLMSELGLLGLMATSGPYAAQADAEQRRWRVALMRYLDLCVARDVTEVANWKHKLPFDLSAFDDAALAKLLAAWRVKRGGAKATDSRLSSKWRLLSNLLKDAWGSTSSPRSLESEYDRYAT